MKGDASAYVDGAASIRSRYLPDPGRKATDPQTAWICFLKIQPEVFFRCILLVRFFLSMGQPFGRSCD